jgi:hypothetical protein
MDSRTVSGHIFRHASFGNFSVKTFLGRVRSGILFSPAAARSPRSLTRDLALNARISSAGRSACALSETALYLHVADEVNRGDIDRGLWVKTFAETDGDGARHKARYLKERVAQLRARPRAG